MSLIDPNLLQLIGLGASGDPDIADGRHLRWVAHRLLGFPRTGFRLRRRPSLLAIDFDAPPAGSPAVRSQLTRRAELGAGAQLRLPSGLTIARAGGFAYGPAEAGGEPLLRLAGAPVTLALGAEGAPAPTSGELLSNPAAYLLLTVMRRSRSGFVLARGSYDARPERRPVDRAAVGGDLWLHAPDLAAELTLVGATSRALSSGERRLGAGAVARRDVQAGAWLAQRGLRPRWAGPPWVADRNPFVTETLLLHGGLLEHIEITGHDAGLLRVQWITSRDLLAAQGWAELGRFFLPLTDAPAIYPAWSSVPGEQVAAERLLAAPPRRPAPWDRASAGDPAVLLAAGPPVADALDARYLGSEFKPFDAAMRTFLSGELQQLLPQALVQVAERLEPAPGELGGPEPLDLTVAPFDLLLGAAADPNVARMLGLATVDQADPAGIYDYAVEAGFPTIWVQWLLQPALARERAERLRKELAGKLANWGDRGPFTPFSVASLLTGLRRGAEPPLAAPAGLRAEVLADPARAPVQARVRLSWALAAGNLFEQPGQLRAQHAFTRLRGADELLLHHRDDETKLLAPHLPTPYGAPEPRLNLIDRALPAYGPHTWRVVAMDLFGRLSPAAEVTAEVRDTLAPPAPTGAAAELLGDAASGAGWAGLAVAFDWLPAQAAQAPDLASFEVFVRQGELGAAEAALPASWPGLESAPGAISAPLQIAWPSLLVSAPAGVSATVQATPLAGGGQRLALQLAPIVCPFDPQGYARLAAGVRAVDRSGNAGGFAAARAERADLRAPAPPSYDEQAQRATLPDAQNRSWFRVPLPAIPGARARVLRAAGVALLAAGQVRPDDFAALAEPAQVGLLRALAAAHREPFATDHEQPLPADGGAHLLALAGFDRGFTVLHVQLESQTGARSAWPASPAGFLVVTPPRAATPPSPLIHELRVGERSVTLWVAADPSGATRALALYRTRSPADAADVRRMRPLATVALPDPPPAQPTPLIDSGLYDDVDYYYRVVAIGAGGLRSAPSLAVCATPLAHGPPPAAVVSAIERDPAQPALRRVHMIVPRRDYRVLLFRRRRLAPAWEPALGGDGALDLTALPLTADPAGYALVVEDSVPLPDAAYAYLARVEDLRGRASAGEPLMEAP